MIGIVTTSSELRDALSGPPFTRLNLECRLATDGAAALAELERFQAALVVMSLKLPDMTGLELCRRVRERREWRHVRVMLATQREEYTPEVGRAAADAGCDDVLEMTLSRQAIYDQMARLLRLPRRLARRVTVDLVTEVEDLDNTKEPVGGRRLFLRAGLFSAVGRAPKGATATGRVVDLSERGAKVLVQRRPKLAIGDRIRLSLSSPVDGDDLRIDARVAWVGGRQEAGGYSLGLQFEQLGRKERSVIWRLIQWDIVEEPEGLRVIVHGEIVEETEFEQLSARLHGKVRFDLGGVRYLNSRGILTWTRFLMDLRDVTDYSFIHCSTAFVLQASFTPALVGAGRVASFWLPVVCPRCNQEDQTLAEVANFRTLKDLLAGLPPCRCGGRMELDEVPDRMLAFLEEHTANRPRPW
ncbi:MAG: response regulator [Deltaproteobacteria bacterium]|nr:response regulator [Deltaproteobacteria bacterium]